MMGVYDIGSYLPLLEEKGGFLSPDFNQLFNGIAAFFYGITKLLWMFFDGLLMTLGDINFFDYGISKVFSFLKPVYDTLFSQVGGLLILFMIAFIYISHYLTRGRQTKQYIIGFLLVLVLNTGFYMKGETLIKDTVKGFESIEKVVSVVLNTALTDDKPIQENNAVDGKEQLKRVRNDLFNQVVVRSFMLMNFDTLDFQEDVHGQYLIKSDLDYDASTKAKDVRKKLVNDTAKDYKMLQSDSVMMKIPLSILSTINASFLGILSVAVVVIGKLLGLIVLIFLALIPFVSILSLIPQFSHALLQAFIKIVMFIATGSFLGVLLGLVFYFMNMIDSVVLETFKTSNGFMVFTTALLLKVLLIQMGRKRQDFIVTFLTGGVIRTPNTTLPKMSDIGSYIGDKAQDVKQNVIDKKNKFNDFMNKNTHEDSDSEKYSVSEKKQEDMTMTYQDNVMNKQAYYYDDTISQQQHHSQNYPTNGYNDVYKHYPSYNDEFSQGNDDSTEQVKRDDVVFNGYDEDKYHYYYDDKHSDNEYNTNDMYYSYDEYNGE